MAIELSKNYTGMLDEVYAGSSKTIDLSAPKELVKAGATAKTVLYPVVDVEGLGDYSRNSGYTDGAVNAEYKELTFDYDRGRRFQIDEMDNQENFDTLLGAVSGEFIRTRVVPEDDAYTFAKIAAAEGISKVSEGVTYQTGEEVLKALQEASSQMDDDEVPSENRILYITPALLAMAQNVDTTKSKEILASFSKIVKVPQSRFYTAIELADGKSDGEEAGHYVKAANAKDINFMIVHVGAVLKIVKHVAGDPIPPKNNPNADATIVKYRKYGLVGVFKNKVAGIYLSHKE